MQHVYVVHYHEIALKGRNRPMFLNQLKENICRTAGLKRNEVKVAAGRLIVGFSTPYPLPLPHEEREIDGRKETNSNPSPLMGESRVRVALSRVFGISSFSPALLVPADYSEIKEKTKTLILASMRVSSQFNKFAIRATRGDKQFPMTSKELEIKLGDFVRKEFEKKVDLDKPDITFYVEVFSAYGGSSAGGPAGAVVYTKRIAGPGGLPVGTQPKVAVLLSGGIDSPVSAYRMMKRGAPLVAVHFHSYPFTSRSSVDKVKELVGILEKYHGGRPIPLYVVPLAEAQKAVVKECDERYRVLLYRRLMWRIAQEIARKEGAQALVSGESLGQVASQTLENLHVVEAVLHYRHPERSRGISYPARYEISPLASRLGRNDDYMPIIRPLIGYDKEEIISEAKRIGTFEVSTLPHDDCCSLFMPKNPATRARIIDVEREESKLNVEKLVELCLRSTSLQPQ